MVQHPSLNRGFCFQTCTTGSKPMKFQSSGTFLPHQRVLLTELEEQSRERCGGMFDVKKITSNAKEYAELAKQLCPNIQIDFISKNLVSEQSGFLNTKWEGVLAVPGTHKVHCIQASGSDKVKVADTSSEMDTDFRLFSIRKSTCVPTQNEEAQELLFTVGLTFLVN